MYKYNIPRNLHPIYGYIDNLCLINYFNNPHGKSFVNSTILYSSTDMNKCKLLPVTFRIRHQNTSMLMNGLLGLST